MFIPERRYGNWILSPPHILVIVPKKKKKKNTKFNIYTLSVEISTFT